ncbi:hypothetical protein Ciccas_001069 [Cichlidogyrus casuarinus]|uniref:Uncharacterized protein n=1 Tax=Cichlidogyrus casuarinus TaxID=1844966 RepID=A0ABD2QNF2_9PLAT
MNGHYSGDYTNEEYYYDDGPIQADSFAHVEFGCTSTPLESMMKPISIWANEHYKPGGESQEQNAEQLVESLDRDPKSVDSFVNKVSEILLKIISEALMQQGAEICKYLIRMDDDLLLYTHESCTIRGYMVSHLEEKLERQIYNWRVSVSEKNLDYQNWYEPYESLIQKLISGLKKRIAKEKRFNDKVRARGSYKIVLFARALLIAAYETYFIFGL